MMIVEFCKYGNLSNYLRSRRGDFVVCKVRSRTLKNILTPQRLVLVQSFVHFFVFSVLYFTVSLIKDNGIAHI